jgi:hypothetical protein
MASLVAPRRDGAPAILGKDGIPTTFLHTSLWSVHAPQAGNKKMAATAVTVTAQGVIDVVLYPSCLAAKSQLASLPRAATR